MREKFHFWAARLLNDIIDNVVWFWDLNTAAGAIWNVEPDGVIARCLEKLGHFDSDMKNNAGKMTPQTPTVSRP